MTVLEAANNNDQILEKYSLNWSVILPRLNTGLAKKIPCISGLNLRYPKDLTFRKFSLDLTVLAGNMFRLGDLEAVHISEGLKPLPLFLFIDIIDSEMRKKTDVLPKANGNNANPNLFWLKDGKKKFFVVVVANNYKWHFFIPNKNQILPESCVVALEK
jgi:hypothetical protein